ncbi:MAG: hypothetical protein K8I27_15060 [Planctomycetes bacterium]|nr:hypothetical protein [Planctomycetota bacterium]
MSTERLTDDEARSMLATAAKVMADMLHRVRGSIEAVNQAEANAIYAAELSARYKDVKRSGTPDDRELVRAHPLYSLLTLAEKLGRSIERILAITNPNLHAERKMAELRAVHAFRQSQVA